MTGQCIPDRTNLISYSPGSRELTFETNNNDLLGWVVSMSDYVTQIGPEVFRAKIYIRCSDRNIISCLTNGGKVGPPAVKDWLNETIQER